MVLVGNLHDLGRPLETSRPAVGQVGIAYRLLSAGWGR